MWRAGGNPKGWVPLQCINADSLGLGFVDEETGEQWETRFFFFPSCCTVGYPTNERRCEVEDLCYGLYCVWDGYGCDFGRLQVLASRLGTTLLSRNRLTELRCHTHIQWPPRVDRKMNFGCLQFLELSNGHDCTFSMNNSPEKKRITEKIPAQWSIHSRSYYISKSNPHTPTILSFPPPPSPSSSMPSS